MNGVFPTHSLLVSCFSIKSATSPRWIELDFGGMASACTRYFPVGGPLSSLGGSTMVHSRPLPMMILCIACWLRNGHFSSVAPMVVKRNLLKAD